MLCVASRDIPMTDAGTGGIQGHFSTEHLRADLKGRSVRGGAVTMAAQALKFVMQTGSIMILARLLAPQDFGLIAMVTVVTGFAAMFKDAGLSMATVQRAEINHKQVSTLFWINVTLSIILTLVVAGLAVPVAWFYGEPRLAWITVTVAGTFVFAGLTIQHQALLRRQLRFIALAAIDIVSLAAGIAVAIISASYGAGYWALVAMLVTTAIANAVLVWLLCGWRPGLPARRTGVRPMLAFGGNLTGSNVLAYARRNLDKVLIGAVSGAGPLGFYSKAYQLLMLPIQQVNSPVSQVAYPTLSRLQDDPDRYRNYYSKAMALMVVFTMPIVAFAFVDAGKLVLIVLGQQWAESVPIFRALGPAAFVGTLNVAGAWVLVSLGRSDRLLRLNIVSTIVVIIAFAIGLRWGPIGVAMAYSVATCAVRIPELTYAFHGTHISLRDLGLAIWRPAVASILAAAMLAQTNGLRASIGILPIDLAIDGTLFLSFYLLVWILVPGGRDFLRQIGRLLQEFSGNSTSRSTGP